MTIRRLRVVGALPLIVAAAPQDEETRKDVRCLLAMSAAAGHEDKTVAAAAQTASQYFLGRIDGRSPNFDLETALTQESASATGPDFTSLLQSCGDLMQKRGAEIVAIGERMVAKAQ